ncbi:MAG: polyprenyl synthetase family protein [Proteobacteria bacterium]|nr:polyprenyl synthetase family protein [Pseudomonadota bacterium]
MVNRQLPEVSKIDEVCAVLWQRKGKRLRAQWVFWFGEAFGRSQKQLKLYAWAVEAIHAATLLHDDVIDRSSLRRGGPSANMLFDNTLPILSGDYLLSDAIFQLAENGSPLLTKLMCQAVKEVTQGEVLQYEHRYKIPEDPNYFDKLNRLKTSSLLKWASQVGAVLANDREDSACSEFANRYGALFQFTDDVLDLRGSSTKEAWQDIREGKVNEVLFLLLSSYPRLKKVLLEAFLTPDIRTEFLEELKYYTKQKMFTENLEYTLERKQNECKEAMRALEPYLGKTLDKLVCLTVQRLF